MRRIPRVAFFTDTFTEINGVALNSRQLTAFAERRGYPFLCVRGAGRGARKQEFSTTHVELARGPLAFSLDRGLRHDPALWRHQSQVARVVEEFKPDIIHVVSPGDVSGIGVYIARRMKLPLAISWHTNLHEFAALRLSKLIRTHGLSRLTESVVLNLLTAFYRLGDVLFAPNDELVDMLRRRTCKPVFLMKRGIDTGLFSPLKRTIDDGLLRVGYVGRITPEKNVRFLRDLETGLRHAGTPPFRFLIVGDGSEREWLRQHLIAADFPGILRGEALAESCANMDVFAFPSRTDTFGNVVLEALASGTPAVVTDAGGPKYIVAEGVTGFVARTGAEFIACVAQLLRDTNLRSRMAQAARRGLPDWDAVFEQVYDGYQVAIAARRPRACLVA